MRTASAFLFKACGDLRIEIDSAVWIDVFVVGVPCRRTQIDVGSMNSATVNQLYAFALSILQSMHPTDSSVNAGGRQWLGQRGDDCAASTHEHVVCATRADPAASLLNLSTMISEFSFCAGGLFFKETTIRDVHCP